MKQAAFLLVVILALPTALWGAEREVLVIQVTGMTCPFCVYGVEKSLSKLPGVEKVEVSLEGKKVRVVMKSDHTADEMRIRKAIRDAGFTPGKIERRTEEE